MQGWQRAFVLHRRPWRETSLLLDLFAQTSGRLSLIAKGARSKKSALKGTLQPFTPLLVQFSGNGTVKTLLRAEAVSTGLPLSGRALYSALYLNELLSRVLEQEIQFPALFFDYLACLQTLAADNGSVEPALRQFELALLEHLGYGTDFLHCAASEQPVADEMTYRYHNKTGFIASLIIDQYSFTGRQLNALAQRQFPDSDSLKAARRFTRMALKPLLGNKPLKSRELFRQWQKPEQQG